MKLETYNGKQYLILDKNEEINISSGQINQFNSLKIENSANGLNITGNSSIVNCISGNKMMEKIYVPPVVKKEEIIEKCDMWIEMFKKTHDYFKKITLSKKAAKENIKMEILFSDFVNSNGEKGHSIDIDLYRLNTIIKEGLTIDVSTSNIYRYLLANVLDYYVSSNYSNASIDINNLNRYLYSKNSKSIYSNIANSDENYNKYYDVIIGILANHNLGESSKQIINNTRNKIYDQQIESNFDKSLEFSISQYNNLFSDSQDPVLKKTIN